MCGEYFQCVASGEPGLVFGEADKCFFSVGRTATASRLGYGPLKHAFQLLPNVNS